jgi:tRNA-splicing ligase RtcB (3'-phosphate/5'-hydroxy nucleic acid ligase)
MPCLRVHRGWPASDSAEAYKDVSEVVDVLEHAGISRNVARLRPMAVIKG